MSIKIAGRRRIKDRHINWKEHYGEKSEALKKHYEKVLPGSYYRWEGFDYETMHPYYIVIGPAISRRFGRMFFSGIKKLPNEKKKKAYSPSGKYFSSLSGAIRHAQDMWGAPYPKECGRYVKGDLSGIKIPKHIY